jgi:hypothetical protein
LAPRIIEAHVPVDLCGDALDVLGEGVDLSGASRRPLEHGAALAAARSHPRDWIVVGSRGRMATAATLTGNTADYVLELVDRPILAVPSSGTPLS